MIANVLTSLYCCVVVRRPPDVVEAEVGQPALGRRGGGDPLELSRWSSLRPAAAAAPCRSASVSSAKFLVFDLDSCCRRSCSLPVGEELDVALRRRACRSPRRRRSRTTCRASACGRSPCRRARRRSSMRVAVVHLGGDQVRAGFLQRRGHRDAAVEVVRRAARGRASSVAASAPRYFSWFSTDQPVADSRCSSAASRAAAGCS